jgi:hypothetical protein
MADFHVVYEPGKSVDSVEMVDAGEEVDSKERQLNVGLAVVYENKKGT